MKTCSNCGVSNLNNQNFYHPRTALKQIKATCWGTAKTLQTAPSTVISPRSPVVPTKPLSASSLETTGIFKNIMKDRIFFQMNITQIASICQFELQFKSQRTTEQVDYPPSLAKSYQNWRSAYLDYYKNLKTRDSTKVVLPKNNLTNIRLRGCNRSNKNFRAKKVISGVGSTPTDRHKQLIEAENQLLYDFHRWLLSPDLLNIRSAIANMAINLADKNQFVEVFLTCTPIDLGKLPWESWEIGADLGTPKKIRIYRTPGTIRHESVSPVRRKIKILSIIGYDDNLNFQTDEKQISSLNHIVEVVPFDCKRYPTEIELKAQILNIIASEPGWDMLFFAGHSNETALTGGELGIAPNVSLAIKDIEEALKIAKGRGLQFAIFNSCNGTNIAESLINLGLSQVAVMREPIHHQVAREFLIQFTKSLAEYKDVYESLLDACQYLKQQVKSFAYPSAYLVPSLYCYPESELFRIKPFGFWDSLKRWLTSKQEKKWLGLLLFLSLLPPVQDLLLEPRILLQTVYRQLTLQIPDQTEPKVVLVKIDKRSLDSDKISQRPPIDYSYLARIINKLSNSGAKLIGIDYILSESDKQPPKNTQSIKKAIENSIDLGTNFVFGYYQKSKDSIKEKVSQEIASPSDRMLGDIAFVPWYIELATSDTKCDRGCPFSYSLALNYLLYVNKLQPTNKRVEELQKTRLQPISIFSQKFLQQWFQPIIDFSIPPDQAYSSISACKFLNTCNVKEEIPENLQQKIVIIAPGGYPEAGIEKEGDDNKTVPLAVAFWRGWEKDFFTGGEAHAYMLHHLLARRLVIPLPDFLIILIAASIAKGFTLVIQDRPSQRKYLFVKFYGGLAAYVIMSLQIYTSFGILVPWFLPSVTFWNYLRLLLRRNANE